MSLSEDGRAHVRQALIERWRVSGSERRLTREERAHQMGLSPATSDRLLRGAGVDRATVLIAFRSLGLEFRESYLESTASQPEPDPLPEAPAAVEARPRERRSTLALTAGLAIAVLCVGGWLITSRIAEPAQWTSEFNQRLRQGTEDYHAARYEEAERKIAPLLVRAKKHSSPGHLSEVFRMLADIASARGEFLLAASRYREALYLRKTFEQSVTEPPIREALAAAEFKLGNFQEAERQLNLAVQGFRKFADENGVAQAMRTWGTLDAAQGDRVSARARFAESLELARARGAVDLEHDVLARIALLDRDEGRLDQARDQLALCLDHWRRRRHPRWVATVQMQLATVELADRNPRKAARLLSSSRVAFVQLGDRAQLSQCEKLLAQCGVHARSAAGPLLLVRE